MRAPSVQLLRALRSATSSNTSASTTHSISSISKPILTRHTTRHEHSPSSARAFTTNPSHSRASPGPPTTRNPYAPKHSDRGPTSKEDTQTDFSAMDVLGHVAAPATSIDACTTDGFHLDNGVKTTGGHGILVVGGEAFLWAPWKHSLSGTGEQQRISDLLSPRGVLEIPPATLGALALLHPKPDLLIVGTGSKLWMLSQQTRRYLSEELGMRIDVMDTANAAAAYNLLAKERGVEGGAGVGGAFLPIGWRGPGGLVGGSGKGKGGR